MEFGFRQILFWVIFYHCLLFLLLFGDSSIKWYVFLFFTIFMSIFSTSIRWEESRQYRSVFYCWLLFLSSLTVSGLFTHSWPLTLDALAFYYFSFLFFSFCLLIDKKFLTLNVIGWTTIALALELGLLSSIFWLRPMWANLLPGMNLLFHTFGHNHLGIVVLLIYPFSWYVSTKMWSTQKIILLIPIILSCLIFFSFGRVIVFLGLIELIATTYILRKQFQFYPLKRLSQFILGILGLILLVMIILSVGSIFNQNYQCYFTHFRNQFCKPLQQEARPKYWQQSLAAINDFSWFGYGPGTFQLISYKYRQNPTNFSVYSHNVWLQMAAEAGLFTTFSFLILIGSIIKKIANKLKVRITYSQKMLVIGLLAILLDVFVDFDWSFLGFFCLTLLVTVALLRTKQIHTKISSSFVQLNRMFFLAVSITILVLSVLFVVTDIYIRKQKIARAFQIFPYFSQNLPVFMEPESLTKDQGHQLFQIFYFHPQLFQSKLVQQEDIETQNFYALFNLENLDFWRVVNSNYVKELLLTNQIEQADRVIDIVHKKTGIIHPKSEEISNIVQQILLFADKEFNNKNYSKAGELYHFAQQLDPWALDKHTPIFLSASDFKYQQQKAFFSQLTSIPGEYFGFYRDDYALKYLQLLGDDIKQQGFIKNDQMLQVLEIAQGQQIKVWEVLSREYLQAVKYALVQGDFELAQKRIETWFANWQQINDKFPILDSQYEQDLAKYLVLIGNLSIGKSTNTLGDNYIKALEINSQILEHNHWIVRKDLSKVNSDELRYYADVFIGKTGAELGWKEQEHLRLYQYLAVMTAKEKDWQSTEKYIKAMTVVNPTEYWSAVQLANYYVWRANQETDKDKWLDLAQSASRDCLIQFHDQHTDCREVLDSIKDNRPNYERYWQVSQIIAGKKRWQDFKTKF